MDKARSSPPTYIHSETYWPSRLMTLSSHNPPAALLHSTMALDATVDGALQSNCQNMLGLSSSVPHWHENQLNKPTLDISRYTDTWGYPGWINHPFKWIIQGDDVIHNELQSKEPNFECRHLAQPTIQAHKSIQRWIIYQPKEKSSSFCAMIEMPLTIGIPFNTK